MSIASNLRRLRADLGASQEDIANVANVRLQEYKRYEAGMVGASEEDLLGLSTALHTTIEVLVGHTRYARVAMAEATAEPKQIYWGEVAVHFDTGSAPILVSVSHEAVLDFRMDLDGSLSPVVVLDGMCNERYVIRRDAISEVFLSAEESDEFGAPGHSYEDFYAIPIIDHRLWDVFTAFQDDDRIDFETFSRGEFGVALSYFMTGQEIDEYLDSCEFGRTESAELQDADLTSRQLLTQFGIACAGEAESLSDEDREFRRRFILERAIGVKFGLKGGTTRTYVLDDGEAMHSMYGELFPSSPGENRFLNVGTVNAQSIYLPMDKIDYVRLPTHQLERSAGGFNLVR